MTIADRLVQELMLVSVLIAGEGAAALGDALAEAGAATDILDAADTEYVPGGGYDLALLLAEPTAAGQADIAPMLDRLAGASERLLFVPLPLGQPAPLPPETMAALTAWFELFAERGFQPVVEFDAGFLAAGAFLVDRAAVAAESELEAFSDRLQFGAPAPADNSAEPPPAEPGLRAALAQAEQQRAALDARIQELETRCRTLEAQTQGWDGVRDWVRGVVGAPGRDSRARLLAALPTLAALRGPHAPPLPNPLADALPNPLANPRPRRAWPRWWRKPAPKPDAIDALLSDMARVRAHPQFDAAWYIASTPELAQDATLDPVFHYVLVGAPRDADPGPWFICADYVAQHPHAAGRAFLHAIHSAAEM